MSSKPSTLKGTRDFGPVEVEKRNYIIETIRQAYLRFGYRPIETPAMEKLETLTGKYGDEGDQLLFKVLNNGDFLSKVKPDLLDQRDSHAVLPQIAKRGLRYDLTVPFARYVAMHQHELAFPWKRYQIQSVWRGDRPQRGRYQEFVQCDADVVGTTSLLCEAEFLQIYDQVFTALGLQVVIHINHRQILAGIAEHFGFGDQFREISVAIDKWDKIGRDKVMDELSSKGLTGDRLPDMLDLYESGNIDSLRDLQPTGTLAEGLAQIDEILSYVDTDAMKQTVRLDIRLARGLSYYTGCIFEVSSAQVDIGSISGGGRYDELTSVFGLKGTSGVGISFGLARIYDVMTELDLFPAKAVKSLDALFLCMDADSLAHGWRMVTGLRASGARVDIYPELAKFKKLMKHADQRGVRRIVIIGEDERQSQLYTLRDMNTGEQQKLSIDDLRSLLVADS